MYGNIKKLNSATSHPFNREAAEDAAIAAHKAAHEAKTSK